jgi:hypothetical protein
MKGVPSLKRFIQVFALVAVVAGVLASTASALAFDDADYIWPTGGVGEPYFKQLLGRTDVGVPGSTGHCDSEKCTFVKLSGDFPPGISMTSSGKVSGIPEKLGTWSFWLQLQGNFGGQPAEREFSITINRIKLRVATEKLPAVVRGTGYSQTLAAEGGSGPKTWTVSAGKLPDGLTLDSATGAITGTPTANGDFAFTVKVADASPAPDTKQLVIRVVDPLVINGFGARDRVAEVGRAYSATLKGSGGTSPYKWVLSGTLPTGFSFDPATGVLSGTPTAPGRIPVKISMEDANGLVQLVDGTLNIVSHVQITSKALAAGAVGRLYSATLRVSGGVRPLTWKVISGKVPTGFRLNARTGLLTGTPRAGGTYRFRVRVTDAVGATWTKPLVLTVR